MEIKEIWNKGKNLSQNPFSKAEMEKMIYPNVKKMNLGMKINIIVFGLFGLFALILSISNLITLISNWSMVIVNISIIIYLVLFLIYGIVSFRKNLSGRIDSNDLLTVINKRISFYGKKMILWFFMFGITLNIFNFELNVTIDSIHGKYVINNPIEFAFLNLFIFLFIGFAGKFAVTAQLQQYQVFRRDLLDGTVSNVIKIRRKHAYKVAALVAFIFILLLATIIFWYKSIK